MYGDPQPLWLEEDTEAALEWADYEASLCAGCSRPRHESFDEHGPDYEVTPLRCRACEAREQEAKDWSSDGVSDTAGLYFSVREAE